MPTHRALSSRIYLSYRQNMSIDLLKELLPLASLYYEDTQAVGITCVSLEWRLDHFQFFGFVFCLLLFCLQDLT